eukprot:CCRYP_019326-RA/>CCRYP_019326-RA protein AED:0.13 eAED:0.95 QI:0/0/0/1/0/0.5/2/0/434
MNTDIVTDTTGLLDDGMDGQGVSSSPVPSEAVPPPTANSAVVSAHDSHVQSASTSDCLDGRSLPDDGEVQQVVHDESFTHVMAADDSQTRAQEDAATSASQGCQSTTCCTENFAVAVDADSTAANTSSHDPARRTLEPCETAPQDNNEDIPPNNNHNAASTLTINKSTSIEDEEDFVAIELVSPTNDVNSTHFMQEEQAGLLAHDHFQSPMSGAPLQSNGIATNNVLHDDRNNNNYNNNNNNNNHRSHHNHPKKKTIHHPLLSPLTKLPWDKFISAAGACDILFNCKYSMRQVEDEVREEKRTIQYRHDDDPPHPPVDVEEEEEDTMQCAERDLEELGLHCCSIIDNDDEDVEDGVDKREDNRQGCQQNVQQSTSEDRNHMLLMEEERANQSWKNSNPSLDMMLYRQFLDDSHHNGNISSYATTAVFVSSQRTK